MSSQEHKVTLKIPTHADYDHIYAMRFTPEVVYWADDEVPNLTMSQYSGDRMNAQFTGEIIERIIVLDGEPIGTVTARDYIEGARQCTLGVVIANPKHWGHGYGFEAIRRFLQILISENIRLVVLETYANNKRAQRCFMKLGFQKKRVFYSPQSGRFVVEMIRKLPPRKYIGEVIKRDDPRWKPPQPKS